MTNDELLATVYANTHHAADEASRLYHLVRAGKVLTKQETIQPINHLAALLQKANAAATELNNRAQGTPPTERQLKSQELYEHKNGNQKSAKCRPRRP